MLDINERLNTLRGELADRKLRVMIIGLGSVGNYLLDYLLSLQDSQLEIIVVGRNADKMESDVNIARVASTIRGCCRSAVKIVGNVDLGNVATINQCLADHQPDIIVNSSRAYPGLKYGSISWNNIRAYGIWAPLAIRYVKNIMQAYEESGCRAIVINTSYSDAVIPWMKSAGKAYPDLGSGNLNHLLPRIKFAVADSIGAEDFWNVDVTLVASHFHDVVISKEGQTEGVEPLIALRYKNQVLDCNMTDIYSKCSIAMPVDAKRNMMNASSNYEIINGIIKAVREGSQAKLLCPGAFGEIGGYPVLFDGTGDEVTASLDTSTFTLDEMRDINRRSIYLDGIERVEDGALYYTDELLAKVQSVFNRSLVKKVAFGDIDDVAQFLVKEIIEPNM